MKLFNVGLNVAGGKGHKAFEMNEYFNIVAECAEDAITGAKQFAADTYKATNFVLLSVSDKGTIDLVY